MFQESVPTFPSRLMSVSDGTNLAGKGAQPWLDIRVIYLRVSGCPLDEESCPLQLHFRIPARELGSEVELNGARIQPLEEVIVELKRDRLDPGSSEATYLSTDSLRLSNSIAMEVLHDGDSLLCGNVERQESRLHGGNKCTKDVVKVDWNLESSCSLGGVGCVFTRSPDFSPPPDLPSLEICIVGKFSSQPIMLTDVVQLIARRRNPRVLSLDAIPEADEVDRSTSSSTSNESEEDKTPDAYASDVRSAGFVGKPSVDAVYPSYYEYTGPETVGMYGEREPPGGEMTWFNAGVRVGMGLGLGMCIGLGLGVGLLIKTYQTTTRNLRKGFI